MPFGKYCRNHSNRIDRQDQRQVTFLWALIANLQELMAAIEVWKAILVELVVAMASLLSLRIFVFDQLIKIDLISLANFPDFVFVKNFHHSLKQMAYCSSASQYPLVFLDLCFPPQLLRVKSRQFLPMISSLSFYPS